MLEIQALGVWKGLIWLRIGVSDTLMKFWVLFNAGNFLTVEELAASRGLLFILRIIQTCA